MKRLLTVAASVALLGAVSSEAQISRTFVSVSGNDGNDCLSPTTACRTLNGGITKVDANGEVIVVDSGSYAGATITKAVKVNVASGVVAFSASSIDSNPGVGNVVVIRGMTLKALTPGASNGLTVTSGSLFLENSVIDGWSIGLHVPSPGNIFVKNSTLRNNTVGLNIAVAAKVAVEGSQFENNATGLSVASGGKVALTRTVMSGNSTAGVHSSGSGSEVTAQFCQVAHNGVGMRATISGKIRLSDSSVTGNTTGIEQSAAGTFETFVTNQIRGNTTDTLGTLTTVALQ